LPGNGWDSGLVCFGSRPRPPPLAERFTAADYAGTSDSFLTAVTGRAVSLGIEVSGSITERALPDGRENQ